MQRFHAERRVGADVDRGAIAPAPVLGHPSVDTLSRQEEARPGPQVSRGEAQTLATAVAGDDLTVEDEATSEGDRRPRQITFGQSLADRGGRHAPSTDLDQRDALRRETERSPERREGVDRAGGLVPEREVRPHHRVTSVEPPDEHVANEVFGGYLRERLVEGQDHEYIDPRAIDESGLPFHGGEEPRFVPRGQDLSWMPIEGDGHRAHVAFASPRDRAGEHLAMSQVDAVEEPDGHDGGLVGEREGVEAVDHMHRLRSLTGPPEPRPPVSLSGSRTP